MTTLREAAQQALEALEQSETTVPYDGFGMARRVAEWKHQAAITALKAALAEPVQEPVAWVLALPDGRLDRLSVVAYDDEAEEMLQRSITGCTLVPLYPAPPQRTPLTEEEIYAAIKGIDSLKAVEVARAIERAHGITGPEDKGG